jgi:hypothetical protein
MRHGEDDAACLLLRVQGLAAGLGVVDLAPRRHVVAHEFNGLFHVARGGRCGIHGEDDAAARGGRCGIAFAHGEDDAA